MATSSLEKIFCPPEAVRGLKVLEKGLFSKIITIPAISVPVKQCSAFLRYFQDYVLKVPGIKKFVTITNTTAGGNENEKLLLLSPTETKLPEDKREWIRNNSGSLTTHQLTLNYTHYTMSDILKAVIPSNEVPTAFETVGHIAHFNLRDHQLPYKSLIGQVVLDKRPNITTVVNKVNEIDETFRTFHMELLAGENNFNTTVHENDCTFKFDFSKVYWNSRLHTEHGRVVKLLKKNDIVLDMFAGVGPFAIPAAKKGCRVFANDLNPYSYSCLVNNGTLNKVNIEAFNLDGRDFVHQIKDKIVQLLLTSSDCATPDGNAVDSNNTNNIHIVMNLPSIAIEFLDCLKGFYNSMPTTKTSLNNLMKGPLIHCYSFSKSSSPERDVLERVQDQIGVQLESYDTFIVRDVSPNKVMIRISFPLPIDALWTVTGIKRSPLSDDDKVEENKEDAAGDYSLTKRRCSEVAKSTAHSLSF